MVSRNQLDGGWAEPENAAAEARHVNRQGGEGNSGTSGERKYREASPCEAGVILRSGKSDKI